MTSLWQMSAVVIFLMELIHPSQRSAAPREADGVFIELLAAGRKDTPECQEVIHPAQTHCRPSDCSSFQSEPVTELLPPVKNSTSSAL